MKIFTTDGHVKELGMDIGVATSIVTTMGNFPASLFTNIADVAHLPIRRAGDDVIFLSSPRYNPQTGDKIRTKFRLQEASINADDRNYVNNTMPLTAANALSDTRFRGVLVHLVRHPSFTGDVWLTGSNFAVRRCPMIGRRLSEEVCSVCGASIVKKTRGVKAPQAFKHPEEGMVVSWQAPFDYVSVMQLMGKLHRDEVNRYYLPSPSETNDGGLVIFLAEGQSIRLAYRGRGARADGYYSQEMVVAEDRYVRWDGQQLQIGSREEVFPRELHLDQLPAALDTLRDDVENLSVSVFSADKAGARSDRDGVRAGIVFSSWTM